MSFAPCPIELGRQRRRDADGQAGVDRGGEDLDGSVGQHLAAAIAEAAPVAAGGALQLEVEVEAAGLTSDDAAGADALPRVTCVERPTEQPGGRRRDVPGRGAALGGLPLEVEARGRERGREGEGEEEGGHQGGE